MENRFFSNGSCQVQILFVQICAILLCALGFILGEDVDVPKVKIDNGELWGETLTNRYTGEPYHSFKGIPYAEPPVGPLRFQPPKILERYEGVMKCDHHRNPCPQSYGCLASFNHSEDCLHLNIYYSKENSLNSLRPVVVFFHGGGFIIGSSNSSQYSPDYLISKGVVLVTLNYRLTIFGFLNLGIKESPGNVGLLDQRAALIWVKKHISKFTGDPENVLITGESAGAASVHYQLLSPLSKGLFHKAILQSGSALDPWASMDPNFSVKRAFHMGKLLKCNTDDVKELHQCLLNAPMEALKSRLLSIITPEDLKSGTPFTFVPSKEITGPDVEKFLPDQPDILSRNSAIDVPVLVGSNDAEGLLFYAMDVFGLARKVTKNVESEMDHKFPKNLENLIKDPENLKEMKSKVRKFYLGDNAFSQEFNLTKFAELCGDINFYKGAYKMIKDGSSNAASKPIYAYQFTFQTLFVPTMMKMTSYPSSLKGSGHADDIPVLFYNQVFNERVQESKKSEFKDATEKMTKLWTDFAKFGNPNGDANNNWKPITPDSASYCQIGAELKILQGFIFEERVKFWDSLYHSAEN